jgi:hypothetical protein
MSLPEAMLPEECSRVCVPLVSVEEVFTPDVVELEVLEVCGVF